MLQKHKKNELYKNYMYSSSFDFINEVGKLLAIDGYKVKVRRVPAGHWLEANASVRTLNKFKNKVLS